MALKPCDINLDDSFGPTVNSCRRRFDFTLTFEQIILTSVPAAIFISMFMPRVWHLRRQDRKVISTPHLNLRTVMKALC